MWPFKRQPVVDADTAEWHANNFAWLVETFGGNDAFVEATLVLPKPGFFPFEGEGGHARALRIFERVKYYCGMEDGWPVHLAEDRNPVAIEDAFRAETAPVGGKYAQGTFSIADGGVQISYTPNLLADPQRLIATFAHELAHFLLATAPTRPPCANDEHEFLTDLTAIHFGFGVFLANTVFEFDGSRMGRSGYLPERDIVFATALFIAVKELDPTPAYACLKPHLAKLLRRALRELAADTRWVDKIRASIPRSTPADAA